MSSVAKGYPACPHLRSHRFKSTYYSRWETSTHVYTRNLQLLSAAIKTRKVTNETQHVSKTNWTKGNLAGSTCYKFHLANLILTIGWFLLRKFLNFQLCMFPHCSHCFTGFRTHFVFSLAQLLPMLVNFLKIAILQLSQNTSKSDKRLKQKATSSF